MPLRVASRLAAVGLLVLTCVHAIAGEPLGMEDFRALNRDIHDAERAAGAVARLRSYLGDAPDSNFVPWARGAIVRGLIQSDAPGAEIAGAADSAEAVLQADPQSRFRFYVDVAQALVIKNTDLTRASGYLHRALQALPPGDARLGPTRSIVKSTLGQAQLMAGHADSAIVSLEQAMYEHPDSSAVLLTLAQAFEKSGKTDEAIGRYVRALGSYPQDDTTAAPLLRALWKKRHGSLAGMDAKVAASFAASRQRIAFDARKASGPAPAWTLKYLDGRPVSLADFKGKVIVLDFWGSWCGPCREELPIFEQMYLRYRDKGIVFLGMNWEQPGDPAARVQKVKDYMTRNGYTFPVVLDHDRVAVQSYQISGFPTVFLIGKDGTLRYKNVGVAPGIETILEDQIQSLLD